LLVRHNHFKTVIHLMISSWSRTGIGLENGFLPWDRSPNLNKSPMAPITLTN
jgi:hypothetical protein